MAVITEAAVRELAGFRGAGCPVTTCYLDVDGRRLSRQGDCEQELERVLRSARSRANGTSSVAARPPAHRGVRPRRHRSHDARGAWPSSRARRTTSGRSCRCRCPVRSRVVINQAPAVGPARVGDPGVRPLRRAAGRPPAGPDVRVPLRRAGRPLRAARRAAARRRRAAVTSTAATLGARSDAQVAAHLRRAADVAFHDVPGRAVRAPDHRADPTRWCARSSRRCTRTCARRLCGRHRRSRSAPAWARSDRRRARRRARGRAPARGGRGRATARGRRDATAGRSSAWPTSCGPLAEHRVEQLLVSAATASRVELRRLRSPGPGRSRRVRRAAPS